MKTYYRIVGKHSEWVIFLLVASLALVGCNKASSAAGFDHAAPKIKAAWDQAVVADQANDYVTAVVLYRRLMANPQLTPGQEQTVKEAASKLSVRIWDAVHKGDQKAQQALAEQQKLNMLPPSTN